MTLRVTFTFAFGTPLLAPVIVKLCGPVGVLGLTVIVVVEVSVLPKGTETGFVPKAAVAPDGRPPALRLTFPLNPLADVTVSVALL